MSLQMSPSSPPPTQARSKPTSPPSFTTSSVTTLSLSLPSSPTVTIHARIQNTGCTNLIFLTTSSSITSSSLSPLGSFVYALPNTRKPNEPLCTPLYAQPQTVDFAVRVAKAVARRTGRPSYVGWSGSVGGAGGGLGGLAEEEMEALRVVIEGLLGALDVGGKEKG